MELWGGFSFTDPRVVEDSGRGIFMDTENDHIKRLAAATGQALERRSGPGCVGCLSGGPGSDRLPRVAPADLCRGLGGSCHRAA